MAMARSFSKGSKESLPRKDSNIIVSIHHEDGEDVVLGLKVRGLKPRGQPMRFFIKLGKPDNPQTLMGPGADLRKWDLSDTSLHLKIAIRKDKKIVKGPSDEGENKPTPQSPNRQNSGGPNDLTNKLNVVKTEDLQLTKTSSTSPASTSLLNGELYELEIRQWPCEIYLDSTRFDVVQPRNRDYSFIILKLRKRDPGVSWKQFQADNGCLDVSLI